MPEPELQFPQHNLWTIVSMAILAGGTAVLLHEGVGHGVTAWLRGDVPTELASNHLSSVRPDRWVDAGGTLVNLAVGALALVGWRRAGNRALLRYFLWLVAAKNLLPGAGYFLYSGIGGFGDWAEVIRGLPHQAAWRIGMSVLGAALYVLCARLLAVAVHPFCPNRGAYNRVGRLPYVADGLLNCAAGVLDPLGWKIFFLSTVAAAFGGSSGMLWLDSLMPRGPVSKPLVVTRQPAWWIAAALFAVFYIGVLGPGIELGRH